MPNPLTGRSIAFLMANSGVEEAELTGPRDALRDAGADVALLAPEQDTIAAMNHDVEPGAEFTASLSVSEAEVGDYDALVIPGGTTNADSLRLDQAAVQFVKDFVAARKTIAAICHGPWMLVEAGVVEGKTLTSYPSLRTDIENAGGTWVDESVHRCPSNGWTLITSRNPDDIPDFNAAIVSDLSTG